MIPENEVIPMKKWFAAVLLAALVLTGCGPKQPEAHEAQLFAMDTLMSLRIWGDEALVTQTEDTLRSLEALLSGKSKGKKGKVLTAMPKENKLLVEGVNVATCHVKARKQNETSGIIKREIPIRADKVQLYCSTCKKGVRVGFKLDGDKKVRVCKKCGKEI